MIGEFARELRRYIVATPQGFYDSFDFTRTGSNFTHPRTLGYIARALWALRGVATVGIDVRFNDGNGVKIQPDAVAFDDNDEPVLLVDYESPNSSDARVPNKNVRRFLTWIDGKQRVPSYVIITTLP